MNEPVVQTMKLTDVRQTFSELVNKIFRREMRIVVEKNGIPVAAIISASDFEKFIRMEEERERDFAIVDEFREAFRGVPDDELEREVARAVAEVREKYRTEVKRTPKAS